MRRQVRKFSYVYINLTKLIVNNNYYLLKTVVIFGEDVAFGGVFRCTLGLAEMFGMLCGYCFN